MSGNPHLAEFEPWCYQRCPFCKNEQTIVINGAVFANKESHPTYDRGYSFCNCKNIFFTDWSNIDTSSYHNPQYAKDHVRDDYREALSKLFRAYKSDFSIHGNGGNRFLDLGTVVSYLMDEAKFYGYDTHGLDISEHKEIGHKMFVCDFDSESINEKFDIIMSNHFLEHIRYPLQAIKKCYDMLNDGGLLFVSMPDTFFINWESPALWAHWIIRQHHILWDMDSFVDEAENIGFRTIIKKHNLDTRPLRDMHILLKK